MVAVNAEFESDLGRLGSPEQITSLRKGIHAALAVTPGDALTATDYPILGFYFTSSAEQFLSYFVTPGRFIRYEVASGRSLTVTVPLDRVSRVVEEAGAEELIVLVELDADAATHAFEAESGPRPDGGTSLMRGVARQTRTVYSMHATSHDEVVRLASFSRSLRATVGL